MCRSNITDLISLLPDVSISFNQSTESPTHTQPTTDSPFPRPWHLHSYMFYLRLEDPIQREGLLSHSQWHLCLLFSLSQLPVIAGSPPLRTLSSQNQGSRSLDSSIRIHTFFHSCFPLQFSAQFPKMGRATSITACLPGATMSIIKKMKGPP